MPGGHTYRFSIQGCRRQFFGSVCSRWVGTDVVVPAELGFQSWRRWFTIHPETVFNQVTPVAALAPGPDHVDLFKVGFDGAVWTTFFHADTEGWRPWSQIRPETVFAQGTPITCLASRPDHIDLFTTGLDGAMWASFFDADAESWRPWSPIHPKTVFPKDQQVVALSRVPGHIDLFIVGHDGAVWSSWWNADGGWRPWFPIHPDTRFAPRTRVSAIARKPDNFDLFVTGLGGAVWTAFFQGDAEGWRRWRPIHPQTVFAQGHPVAVVSRRSEHIDLFKVGFDGAIWSAWWAP